MARNYWYYDWGNTASASTTTDSSYTSAWVTAIVQRIWRILVFRPDHWSDEDEDAYVRMVNLETNTGWTVELVIRGGSVGIADPDIETRTMEDFLPLLKKRASAEDRKKIDAFFKSHPLHPPTAE